MEILCDLPVWLFQLNGGSEKSGQFRDRQAHLRSSCKCGGGYQMKQATHDTSIVPYELDYRAPGRFLDKRTDIPHIPRLSAILAGSPARLPTSRRRSFSMQIQALGKSPGDVMFAQAG